MRDWALRILKFLFAAGMIYWLWKADKIDFKVLTKVLDPKWGSVVLLCTLISLSTFVARLHLILKAKGIAKNYWHTWRLSMMGMFFNFTLPGGMSGDLVKIYYLAKDNKDKRGEAVGLVIFDRVVGLFGMMLMAFIALLVRPHELFRQMDLQVIFTFLGLGLLGLVGLIGFFVYCSKTPEISHPLLNRLLEFKILKKVYDVATYVADLGLFFKALFFTFISQGFAVLLLFFAAKAIGYTDLDLVAFYIVAPLGFITTAVPISPGGVGVGQVAFLALFKIYTGIDSDLGPTVVTVYQIILFMAGLTGLYHYLRWTGKKNVFQSPVIS